MARYIRYLENGTWKYASIKDVGDITLLTTTDKSSVVNAINELEDKNSNLETNQTKIQTDISDVQTELVDKADLTYVDGELVKKVDTTQYQTEYQDTQNALTTKVDADQYNTDYQNVNNEIATKVAQTDFDNLSGVVSTNETSITNINGELETKVAQTDFDDAVGVNKWTASKYLITGTDLVTTAPSFALIKGINASEVKEIADSTSLVAYTDTNAITHLFTNIRLDQSKIITLNVTFNTSIGIYMNGAMIHQEASNEQVAVPVSLSLRAGWNTVEILLGNGATTTPVLKLDSVISSQVTKMTTVIGVGNKDETRLTQAETSIKQNADSIELKAEKTDVEALGNRVSTNESSISVLNNEITTKVEQVDFDAYSQKVDTNTSTITQNSDAIALKVDQTNFDTLNGRVTDNETSITQNTNSISLKADQTTVDGLSGRMSNAETSITQNTNEIALKASQTDLDTTNGRLTTAESNITQNTNEIALKVSQTDFDNLDGRVTTNETSITQNANEISLKANSSDVYTITQVDTKFSDANTSITQNTNEIALKANSTDVYTKTDIDGQMGDKANQTDLDAVVTRVTTAETSITQNSNEIALKASQSDLDTITGRVSTAETNITQNSNEIALKADQTDLDTLTGTVSNNETSITQNANEIALKASQSDLDALTGRVSTTETSITENANEIALKANQSDLDTLNGKVSTNETNITQNANNIILKANSTDVYTKTQVDTSLGNKANQSDLNTTNSNLSSLTTRVTNAESSITENSENITLKVSTTTYSSDMNTVNTNISKAQSTADSKSKTFTSTPTIPYYTGDIWKNGSTTYICQTTRTSGSYTSSDWVKTGDVTGSNTSADTAKVNGVSASDITTRLSSAESSITQNANNIALKVSTTDYNGNQIASLINQSATTIKLEASQIDLQGKVSFSDLDSSAQNTVNGKASQLSVDDINLKLNNAVTTIDNTGVTVTDGSFFIKNGTAKTTLIPSSNLLADSSFELMSFDDSVGTYGSQLIFPVDTQQVYYGTWGFVGRPYVQLTDDTHYGDTIFGKQSAIVNSANYVRNTYTMVKKGGTFTLSAFFKKSGLGSGGTGKMVVKIVDASTSAIKWSQTFIAPSGVPSTGTYRYSMTFTLPSTIDIGYDYNTAFEVDISSYNTNWICVDGVQLIEGNYPTFYNTNDDFWLFTQGNTKAQVVTSALFSGDDTNFNHAYAYQLDLGIPIVPFIHDFIPMANGWGSYGGSQYEMPAYTKTPDGYCHLRGMMAGGTTSSYVQCGTLPAGCRPFGREIFVIYTATGAVRCDVDSNGAILYNGSSNVWVSLSGISFKCEN